MAVTVLCIFKWITETEIGIAMKFTRALQSGTVIESTRFWVYSESPHSENKMASS